MGKRLKNNTGGNLDVLGQTIASGAYYDIPQFDDYAFRDDADIEALIDSADLIFNDGTSDITNTTTAKRLLNAREAYDVEFREDALESNGFTSTEVQSAIEEARDSARGTLLQYNFISNGNTANKWLSFGSGGFATSDIVPMVVPQDSKLLGITYTNQDDDTDCDLEIYINGTLEHTEEIRNKRVSWIVGTLFATPMQGDRISVYLKKYTGGTGDSTPQNPLISLIGKFVNEVAADSGIQNGL